MKKIIGYVLAFFIFGIMILDGLDFILVCNSDYKTPWYKVDWVLHPVINTVLYFSPSKEYWTMNGTGTEEWFIREVSFAGKEFWTILERIEIPLEIK